jgi:hypothetical protein
MLNIGDAPAFTRAFGYRSAAGDAPHEGTSPSQQMFDSGDAEVGANAQRLSIWEVVFLDQPIGQYWVKILSTSPNLVPSIEFWSDDPVDDTHVGTIFLRYLPGDFAVFHHRIRYVPQPIPVGPILSEQ